MMSTHRRQGNCPLYSVRTSQITQCASIRNTGSSTGSTHYIAAFIWFLRVQWY